MRNTRLKPQEIAERDEMNRTERRKSGFDLMPIRDRGWAVLSNGVRVRWHTDKFDDYGIRSTVPDGTFEIDGKLYNAEELMKFLRWA